MKTSFKSEIKDFEITSVFHGVRGAHRDKGPVVELSFRALAKGRLVAWNKITGYVPAMPVSKISSKGFGPLKISFEDFHWSVHIKRNGNNVTRSMKPTPRKHAINAALVQILAPALVLSTADNPSQTEPEAPKVVKTGLERDAERAAAERAAEVATERAAEAAAEQTAKLNSDSKFEDLVVRGAKLKAKKSVLGGRPLTEMVKSDPDGVVDDLEAVGLKVTTEIPKVDLSLKTDPLEMPDFLRR